MAEGITVTRQAMDRYRERVADVSDRAIIEALTGPAFTLALEFGAPFVKLPSGHHAVIREASVITILPREACRQLFDRTTNPELQQEQPQP